MQTELLDEIISKHARGQKAELQGKYLGFTNLSEVNLNRADLRGSNLRWAILSHSNLNGANLNGANLNGANLNGANLSGANLSGANLCKANLYEANLHEANLSGCDLNHSDLEWTTLSGANLIGANLQGANLTNTILSSLRDGEIVIIGNVAYMLFDPRGWLLSATLSNGQLNIMAGCHSFNEQEAIDHWSGGDYEDKKLGKKYLESISMLKNEHRGKSDD